MSNNDAAILGERGSVPRREEKKSIASALENAFGCVHTTYRARAVKARKFRNGESGDVAEKILLQRKGE